MPWRYPMYTLVGAAFGAWPAWASEAAVVAMTAQDWNGIIQSVGVAVGAAATGVVGARVVYLKAYEGSAKQQLDENTRSLVAVLADNADLKAENAKLKANLVDRDRVIAARDAAILDRDRTIAARDLAIDEMMRSIRRLSNDTADMAEAFLIGKGDAKPKVAR